MPAFDPRIRTALVSINPTTLHPGWHGAPSVLGLLRGVTPAAAVWRPIPTMNNIREIALHVAFCDNSVANVLSGELMRVKFKQRINGWPERLKKIDEAQWTQEVAMVTEAHERLVRIVAAFDPRRLDKTPIRATKRPAIEYMHGVAEHKLYHAAQVKALKLLSEHAGV